MSTIFGTGGRIIALLALCLSLVLALAAPAVAAPDAVAAVPPAAAAEICEDLYGDDFDLPPSGEPLADCQWDMALINAGTDAWQSATGEGVTVGVLDTGVDIHHPDIAPNLDLSLSCSFIFDHTPTAEPAEVANGDCSNTAAIDDLNGHGTHVASIIAAPVNGVGIAGVAPDATIVALKVCTAGGYCFADSVAAALRYAGDVGLDIVNLSLFADPYLYYCKNDAEQRRILKELESATRYAQQRGVLVVSSAGNEASDLQHPPETDTSSPNWPPGTAEEREIGNQCRVAPAELPGVLTVSSVGPLELASYSTVGMSRVDVTAPGGDYFAATDTVQDAILAAVPADGALFAQLDPLTPFFPGVTVLDDGAAYAYLNGTSMSSPHAAGVAALIAENHPDWRPGALKAAVQRTAMSLDCPADWPEDDPRRCYGSGGRTSFYGHGLVDALAAARL